MLAAALASPAAAAPLPRPGTPWIALETPALSVLSNASPEATHRLLAELESFRRALGVLLGEQTTASAVPTLVYLFRDGGDFATYDAERPECRGERCAAGWFLATRQVNLVAVDASVAEAARVALHEYVHFLVENTAPGLPLWLDEGLAEFYSTFEVTRRGAAVGRPIESHVRLLAQGRPPRLAELFTVGHEAPAGGGHERSALFYAEAWALTHYLLVGDERRAPAGAELVARLAAGESEESAFRATLGLELRDLERALAVYVRGPRFAYRILPYAATPEPGVPPARTVARAEALGRLGYLLAQFGDRALAAAEEHCAAALEAGPGEGWAQLGLAHVALTRGEGEAAVEWAAAAAGAAPAEPLAHELLGTAVLDGLRAREPADPAADAAAVELARASFARALEGAPGFAPALAGLGFSYYWEEDPIPGLPPARAAARLMPHREDLAFDYLALAARAGEVELAREAFGLLERQAARLPQERLATARRVLFEAELVRWQRAIRGPGDYEAALAELDALLARAPDEGVRGEWAAERRELARTVERNRLVALYNRALSLAGAGRHEEAAELLREVAASPLDALLAAEAGALLRRLEG